MQHKCWKPPHCGTDHMTINTSRFELVLSQKLAQVGASTSNLDLLMYSSALEKIRSGTVFVVSTFSSLPDAALNLGKLYFVQDSEELFWSNAEYGWLSMYPGSLNYTWAWGRGPLGDGAGTDKSSPVSVVGGFTDWCQVSNGCLHSTAIRIDGTAWAWGSGGNGQLGNNTNSNQFAPVSVVGVGARWCQISAGSYHTAAVKIDGTAWTWGENGKGELGNNTDVDTNSPVQPAGVNTGWCQISAGRDHTAAVKSDGTAWTWGENGDGQLGDGTDVDRSSPVAVLGTITTWCQISAGGGHTAAIKTDGAAWTWGLNNCGQLGDNSAGVGTNKSSPVQAAGFNSNWCQISAGNTHTAAIKKDNTAWTWGNNSSGQLGNNSVLPRSSPGTTAGGGTTWCQISAGNCHTAAVKTDGTVWNWGRNTNGQLGDNTLLPRSSPLAPLGVNADWCQVSAGGLHTTAIKSITF